VGFWLLTITTYSTIGSEDYSTMLFSKSSHHYVLVHHYIIF